MSYIETKQLHRIQLTIVNATSEREKNTSVALVFTLSRLFKKNNIFCHSKLDFL